MAPRPQTARAQHYLRMKNLPRIALAALLALPIASFAQSSVQVGFSPEGFARKLVLDTIASAKTSIQVLAYAFQAPDIAQALVAAHQRGVDVRAKRSRLARERPATAMPGCMTCGTAQPAR